MTLVEKKKALIEQEWQLFQQVHNEGGRAACQNDRPTFYLMRLSQFAPWPEDLTESYRCDLTQAAHAGRNLLAEKYAWMMEYTHPQQFALLRGQLPELPAAALAEIEACVAMQMAWMADYRRRYPALAAGGRAFSAAEDTAADTSFETYLRGELKTYSLATLRHYRAFLEERKQNGENPVLETMTVTVRGYGYTSLEDAEQQLTPRRA